jgi:hypothetical protein
MYRFIEPLENRRLLSGGLSCSTVAASAAVPAVIARATPAKASAPSVNLVGVWSGGYLSTDGFTGSVGVVVKSQTKSTATGAIYVDGVAYRGTAKLVTGTNGTFTLTYKIKGFWGVAAGQVVGNTASGSYTYRIGNGPIYSGSFTVTR